MQKCEISRERMKATIFIDHSNGRKRIVEKGVVVLAVVFFFSACCRIADSLLVAHVGSRSAALEAQHRLLSPM